MCLTGNWYSGDLPVIGNFAPKCFRTSSSLKFIGMSRMNIRDDDSSIATSKSKSRGASSKAVVALYCSLARDLMATGSKQTDSVSAIGCLFCVLSTVWCPERIERECRKKSASHWQENCGSALDSSANVQAPAQTPASLQRRHSLTHRH
jgi:hypothetical protein